MNTPSANTAERRCAVRYPSASPRKRWSAYRSAAMGVPVGGRADEARPWTELFAARFEYVLEACCGYAAQALSWP
jgi:hypothetical protein